MSAKRTVFILGAGAGHDLGMPLGSNLLDTVAGATKISEGDMGELRLTKEARGILECFERVHQDSVIHAFRRIHDGIYLRRSIDDFIDLHRNDETIVRVGKMLIAQSILLAEKNSKLWFSHESSRNRLDISRLSDTWLIRLFRQLGRGDTVNDFMKCLDRVTFISFNYDRCLEHFLIHAIQSIYPLAQDKAHALVYGAEIIHPYGVVGQLPSLPRDPRGIPFGDRDTSSLFQIASNLNTYSEQLADTKMVNRIHNAVQNARALVFLGLHFHEPNMKVISPPGGTFANDIFATAFGRSEEDRGLIFADLKNLAHGQSAIHRYQDDRRIRINERYTCASIFDQHERSLLI